MLGFNRDDIGSTHIAMAGDPPNQPEVVVVDERLTTRAEIEEGIQRITRQLEVLRAGPTLGEPSDDVALIAELEAELDALRRRAADLA